MNAAPALATPMPASGCRAAQNSTDNPTRASAGTSTHTHAKVPGVCTEEAPATPPWPSTALAATSFAPSARGTARANSAGSRRTRRTQQPCVRSRV